ncbi:MAG: transglutaminase domain-containing protein [Qingshengfaniella sp.]
MKLSVTHRTVYRYDEPQAFVLQSHRLIPTAFEGQRIEHWAVTVPDGIEGSRFRDGAGDMTGLVRVRGPVDEVVVEIAGVVETTDLSGVLRGHREKVPPQVYLQSTRSTRIDLGLGDLAAASAEGVAEGDVLARAHALSHAVAEAIAYVPGATGADTTAAEALALGQGVCQDHAHALIAAARSAGIPARYVAGYLFAGADTEDGPGSEASHAWAELFVGGLGWVGFDPSNGCCPDERYIRLCSGADAFDAAPIRGLASGAGEEMLDVAVAVQSVQQ